MYGRDSLANQQEKAVSK